MTSRPFRNLAPFLALVVLPACAATGKSMPEIAAEINATRDSHPSRFLPGDSVGLRFAHDANLDQTVRIDPNGDASFLLIGRLNVAGKLPEQLREELERAYTAKLTAPPDVSVNLIELSPVGAEIPPNRAIHVLGEVKNPGQFAYAGQQITLIDALARAGGHLKPTANLKNVLLVRWMPEQNNWRGWRIDARIDNWSAAQQILMQPSDLVYVPNTPIDDVDIWVDQYIRQLIPFPYLIPAPR